MFFFLRISQDSNNQEANSSTKSSLIFLWSAVYMFCFYHGLRRFGVYGEGWSENRRRSRHGLGSLIFSSKVEKGEATLSGNRFSRIGNPLLSTGADDDVLVELPHVFMERVHQLEAVCGAFISKFTLYVLMQGFSTCPTSSALIV